MFQVSEGSTEYRILGGFVKVVDAPIEGTVGPEEEVSTDEDEVESVDKGPYVWRDPVVDLDEGMGPIYTHDGGGSE